MAPRNGYHWLNKPPLGAQLDTSCELAAGLVGYWLMNEGGGLAINDLTQNKFTGTLSGTSGTTWTPGTYGTALAIAGANRFGNALISLGTNCLLGMGTTAWPDFTITYVGSVTGELTGNPNVFFTHHAGTFGNQLVIQLTSTGKIGFNFTSNVTGTVTFPAETPGVYSFVKSGGNFSWYANSVLQENLTLVGGSTITGDDTKTKQLCSFVGSATFAPSIVDEFLLHNRALSPADVASLCEERYALVLPPNTRRWFVPAAAPAGGAKQLLTCLGCGA